MAFNTDKNVYTVVFAGVMVVVVGSLLAFMATGLESRIAENERFEKQQNILYAMGVDKNVDKGSVNFVPADIVEGVFEKYIVDQLVIKGDSLIENNEAYLIDVEKQLTLAKKGEPAKLPLFIGEKDGKKLYIIPMYGKGLWDAIWGFIALDKNMVVQGVFFDHKGETPGLGANINQRYFMDDFTGESIMQDTRYAGISVAKGNNDPLNERKNDNKVDALAGATITGNGVSNMITQSVNLYKDYLNTIRTN